MAAKRAKRTKKSEAAASSTMPVLLRYYEEHAQALAATEGDVATRHKLLAFLTQKILSLNSTISALESRLVGITDPKQYQRVTSRVIDARGERDLCQARSQAINASQPFKDPGEAAESALRAAIAVVDQSLAATTALADLLAAAEGLVRAYGADQT